MGRSITQQVLVAAIEEESAAPGELIFPPYTFAYGTERTLPAAARLLGEMDFQKPASPDNIVAVSTQTVSGDDGTHALREQHLGNSVQSLGIQQYFPGGRGGVAPLHLIQEGLVVPGDIVVGGDAHAAMLGAMGVVAFQVGSTDLAVALALGKHWMYMPETVRITFRGEPGQLISGKDVGLLMLREIDVAQTGGRSIELGGEAITALSPSGRFTLAEMAMDLGGTNGIMAPDDTMLEYLAAFSTNREARYYFPDEDADYEATMELDVTELTPMVHELGDQQKIYSIEAVADEIPVHQVIIGGCGGGQMEEFQAVAGLMKYRQIPDHVQVHILPATTGTYRQMINRGLASIFSELGAIIWPPGCNLCPDSAFHGIAPGENVVTTGRGRRLRQGNRIWSTGVAVAAAAAVMGRLADPGAVMAESGNGETPPDVDIEEFMRG